MESKSKTLKVGEASSWPTVGCDGIAVLEELLTSLETQRKLSEIGEGSEFTYDAISGVEEAATLIASL